MKRTTRGSASGFVIQPRRLLGCILLTAFLTPADNALRAADYPEGSVGKWMVDHGYDTGLAIPSKPGRRV